MQQTLSASFFVERENAKMEPCIKKEKNSIELNHNEIDPNKLMQKKLTFDDLMMVMRKSKPSVRMEEVRKFYAFERKHPTITILDK